MSKTEWTFSTLRKFLLSIIDGDRQVWQTRFKAMDKANKVALAGQKILDKKNNEFRTQLDRQADTFATKSEMNNRVATLTDVVDANKISSDDRSSRNSEQIAAINLAIKDVPTKADVEAIRSVLQEQVTSLNSSRSQGLGQTEQKVVNSGNDRWVIGIIAGLPGIILVVIEIVRISGSTK